MQLFDLLAAKFPDHSAASIAAMLGLSRQAYAQASTRRRLSDAAALRAAALLEIDPGAALLANATGQHPAPPVNHPAPHLAGDAAECLAHNTNYAKLRSPKKSGQCRRDMTKVQITPVHNIISNDRADALDLVKWVFAVANIRADSPRFAYYVSRWNVPEKIATAKAAGTFAALIATCPPIDPDWLRFVPNALDECRRFSAEISAQRKTRPSSSTPTAARKMLTAKAA
jgi:hypothetical protein